MKTYQNPYFKKLHRKQLAWRRILGLSYREFFIRWEYEYNKIMDKIRSGLRASYKRHAERRREDARRQRKERKLDPIRQKAHLEYLKNKLAFRMKNDPVFVLRKRTRGRILEALRRGDAKKITNTMKLIGCSIKELKSYIESKWSLGMNWENYGFKGWHIDHIKPCASFNLSDPEQQKACFHYTNLQPLWALDNWRKGSNE